VEDKFMEQLCALVAPYNKSSKYIKERFDIAAKDQLYKIIRD